MHWNSKHSDQNNVSMGRRITPKEEPAEKRASKKLRLPSFDFKKFGTLVAVLVILGGAVTLGYFYQSQNVIRSVEVSGNYFTEASEVIEKGNIPLNVSPDSVRFLSALTSIETLPYIREASIRVGQTGRVAITVTEREPIGMFIHGSRKAYIDADGVILPIRHGRAADVPLIYGISWSARQDIVSTRAFIQIRDFLNEVQRMPLASATLSEIAWTTDEGIVALSHENGIRLVFGNDRFSDSIRNWDLFYKQVVTTHGPENFTSIDLRYNGQIVTRES